MNRLKKWIFSLVFMPYLTHLYGDVESINSLKMANQRYQEGNYDDAITHYQEVLNDPLNPKDAKQRSQIYLRLITSYFQTGQYQKIIDSSKFYKDLDSPEISYYLGCAHLRLGHFSMARETLTQVSDKLPEALLALTQTYNHDDDKEPSEDLYNQLLTHFPTSIHCGEALFYLAEIKEEKGEIEQAELLRRRCWTQYPASPFAAEAYYRTLPATLYLNGSPSGLKHLKELPLLFPNSPFAIQAHYILGLHAKESAPREAIDHFQQAEAVYSSVRPNDDYYNSLLYRLRLESALCHMDIASKSKGAKQTLHLEYGYRILKDLATTTSPFIDETLYSLAKCQIQSGHFQDAYLTLDNLIEKGQGYYLNRALYERGCLHFAVEKPVEALQLLLKAEEMIATSGLTGDETIDIYIKESECYRILNRPNDAIKILSKAVNADVISSLRLQAMYLRGEIYMEQQRFDLAKRQFEALKTKSGDWSQKAQEKLLTIQKDTRVDPITRSQ
jgi:tetratricopeptide (TPR) repeat protein